MLFGPNAEPGPNELFGVTLEPLEKLPDAVVVLLLVVLLTECEACVVTSDRLNSSPPVPRPVCAIRPSNELGMRSFLSVVPELTRY